MDEPSNAKGEGKTVSVYKGREEQTGPMYSVIATDFPDVIRHSREESW